MTGLSAVKLALLAEQARAAAAAVAREPIAVVGFNCRFPGGEDPEQFWSLLADARCAAGPVPPDRWDAAALHHADHTTPGTITPVRGAFLEDISGFDAALFGIAGREAASLDPQQRILLEVAWQALERGAIAPDRLGGTATGIFVGVASADYAARIIATGEPALLDAHFGSGNSPAFAAGRLAYQLGTHGPAMTIDATCAGSLVALHQACRSLQAGDCDLALAGGVHLSLAPGERISLSRAGALAADGVSKPFAAEADGFGGGEGCAVVVLMRLSRALREGYAVAGLIRGSAVGHDGASGGLTVPSAAAQTQVIRAALDAAGLAPEDIDFCETHGTGTRLGDPIELNALSAVFACRTAALPIGAVKANIGHAQAAAGLAGVVKLLLALQHETLPAQPPIGAPTALVDWAASRLVLATRQLPWPRAARPRRAGVSAFGLSGTNAHVIIEEAPLLPRSRAETSERLLYPLSAPDPARLQDLAARAALAIRADPEAPLAAICSSATIGRARHRLRTTIAVTDRAGLLAGLDAIAGGALPPYQDPPAGEQRPIRIAQPALAFKRETFWFAARQEPAGIPTELTTLLAKALGEAPDTIQPDRPFAELGADSIMLADAARTLTGRYGIPIPLHELLTNLNTASALAAYIDAKRPGAPPLDPAKGNALGTHSTADNLRAAHTADLITAYTRRTGRSKLLAEQRRPRFADVRGSAGFRPSIKEMLYPITGERADGATIHDVDGNQYIDISMDFGVNLFGHGAKFIRDAMVEQLDRGLALGPRSPLAGEVAELLCDLTGMDRVLFTQSGSEAVMTAARLARLVRGRPKLAIFRNSYHGHFDGFLGERVDGDGSSAVLPAAPGILGDFVGQLMVLDYGTESALTAIAAAADSLAAVLVEPVQSRALHLQPREFLHALRALTERHGILLIFDEMITGLRVHPGGAQAVFGVRADLATYGKTLGGGVPMAALAARGSLLDGIDGGAWRFGDGSRPSGETTFFAGTFNNHPLGLAAARAVLGELRRAGPALQATLNDTTAGLADRLNDGFAAAGVKLSVARFGSVFRFVHAGNLDLLYYHLLHRGLFVWEGRNCFLSTAHTPADIDAIVDRTLDAVTALQDGGWLPGIKPAAPLPMSHTQRQIWLAAERAAPGEDPYVETLVADIGGGVDAIALQHRLDALCQRHDALRATIDPAGTTIHVARHGRLALQHAPEGSDPAAWIAQLAHAPFELTTSPPLRVGLLRLEDGLHRLVLVAHHILLDGWSLRLLLQELDGQDAGSAPVQLGDHLRRLARQRDAAPLAGEQAYWQRLLDTPPAPLPLDHGGRKGARVRLDVPPQSVAALAELAQQAGTTLFVAAVAATTSYLCLLYGVDDLIVGTPASGRSPEEASLVGQAAQIMPIRARIMPGTTLRMHLDRLAAQLAASADRESRIELAPVLAADAAATRALNVTFNLDRARSNTTAVLREAPCGGVKFDLCMNLTLVGQAGVLELDYARDAAAPAAMRRFGARWIRWIDTRPGALAQPIEGQSVLDEADLALIGRGNATGHDFADPRLIPDLIAAQAAAHPDRIAVSFDGATLTYGALSAAAGRLAAGLAARRIGPASIVACLLPRSADLVVALLGIALAGAAFLPLDPEEPVERVAALLSDAAPALLVTRAAVVAGHVGLPPVLLLDDPTPAALAGPCPARDHHLAYVLFTSGSTGRPKAVLSEHAGLRNRTLWMNQRFPLHPGDAVLQKTPATFDVSVWEFFWPLSQGARLVVCPPGLHRDPAGLARLIQAERVTIVHFVPAMLEVFLEQPAAGGCRSLARVFCSGEALSAALRDRFFAAGLPAELHNLYGPTEASIDVTHFMCRADDHGPVPIGHPIANTQIHILDGGRQPVAPGVEGDLYIGGVQVARGYLNRPELTAERFIADPFVPGGRLYWTGDRACYREDGAILYRGRADRQRKLRGVRIEPGEIEARLREHPAVTDAVVDIRGDDDPAAARLVAWIVPAAAVHAGVTFTDDAAEGLHRTTLPGGQTLVCRNPAEARFMIEECFGDQGFDLAALGLPPRAFVIDAGANIGVFSLAVLAACPEATVHAFEPIPAIHALLARNAAAAGGKIRPVCEALGATAGEAVFTWYPDVSILSGRHADPADRDVVMAFLRRGDAAVDTERLRELAEARLQGCEVRCRVGTLSGLIRACAPARIDLLKIDVEGDETAVLEGLETAHWPLIDRLLIEMADRDGAEALRAALAARGFHVAVRQAPWADGTGLVLLTAVHARVGGVPPPRRAPLLDLAGTLRAHLARVLPAVMVPAVYCPIAALPLTRHGKLDRAALPDPGGRAPPPGGTPPRTPTEQVLLAHWREVLGLPVTGVEQDFFAAGGQSLAAARLAGWVQERFGVAIRLRAFLQRPTIAQLAELIAAAGEAQPVEAIRPRVRRAIL